MVSTRPPPRTSACGRWASRRSPVTTRTTSPHPPTRHRKRTPMTVHAHATLPDDDATTVAEVVAAARTATGVLAATSRDERARMLEAMAEELDAASEPLVDLADAETHLGADMLRAEVGRTTGQLRFFADVLRDGAYLELATDTDRGPETQHRMLLPLGVAAVFGSSNFPFAYGVAGGDTASALAAGCAVVVKEHPSHPLTCRAVLDALRTALRRLGLPEAVVSLVRGFEAGALLVTAPAVRAVGFTGSVRGGRALHDLCVNRADPIPFYGELGSLNPVVVTTGAAGRRAQQVGDLLADSMTRRGGQMCTQPGLILLPTGPEGDAVLDVIAAAVDTADAVTLLNDAVRGQFGEGTLALAGLPGAVVRAGALPGQDAAVWPLLVETSASAASGAGLEEVFGPVSLVLRYRDVAEVVEVIASLKAALVAGVHAEPDEADAVAALVAGLTPLVGRLVWGAPTTGLAVGWATHHGGSYPASTSTHTSVGATAIRRWLRPISFQGFPEELLPAELRSGDAPRRLDGAPPR
ncbi:MAG: aldehyde dehydrogenase family protein [Georgenia sp.]